MSRCPQSRHCVGFTVLVGFALLAARPLMTVAEATTGPRNIIVIMADDMELNDLPFFADEPIQWDHENNPNPDPGLLGATGAATSAEQPQFGEARRRLPGLNRLAARLFAAADRHLGTYPVGAVAGAFTVVPGDLDENGDTTVASFTYDSSASGSPCQSQSEATFRGDPNDPMNNGCTPQRASTDILSNYGGLARLAGANSIVFPRFYSNSAVCAPTRGAFLTGRSHVRLNMPKFGSSLQNDEITIAEFLKQGCKSDPLATPPPKHRLCVDWNVSPPAFVDCPCYLHEDQGPDECPGIDSNAACYTTGAIGKWGIGSGQKTPWHQGFDEYIGFLGPNRPYFSLGKITCSPDTQRYCSGGSNAGQPCLADGDCMGMGAFCDAEPGFRQTTPTGLYIGPDRDHVNACTDDAPQKAQEAPLCCDPDGKKDKKAKGTYYFAGKKDAGGNLVFFKEGTLHCSDDGDVTQSGCPYYTRVIRDHAKAFISRHADDDDPFFLFVSFNAIHKPLKAPERTLAHYKRKKNANSDPFNTKKALKAQYLAMTEELDAAVGGIIDELKANLKDGTPTGHADISGNTMILFIADQGKGRNFGNPDLAGGKGTVMDGGIRIGMLAYDGGDLFNSGNQAKVMGDDYVGSMVDLFPTIAQAAGYDNPAFTSGAANGIFDTNGKIAISLTNEGGKAKPIDGTSLIELMKDDPTMGERVASARDVIYADYSLRDGYTVVTREGYYLEAADKCNNDPANCAYAAKVCGYESAVRTQVCTAGMIGTDSTIGNSCDSNSDCGTGGACGPTDRSVRFVRGGSCIPCSSSGFCDGSDPNVPSPQACTILGGVCLDTSDQTLITNCTNTDFSDSCPDVDTLPRCHEDKDCPKVGTIQYRCYNDFDKPIKVACNGCFPAAWKYRSKKSEAKKGKTRLTDLRTNPEEDGTLECYNTACGGSVATSTTTTTTIPGQPPTGAEKLCAVQNDLDNVLCRWQGCVSKKSGSGCIDSSVCEGAAGVPGTCAASQCAMP